MQNPRRAPADEDIRDSQEAEESDVRKIVRVVSGNFLEMFDFTAYGIYSGMIAQVYFPSANPYISIMLALGTFGAGFLMRPLGALVLGSYLDRHGARKGLFLSLSIMAAGTLLIACVPGYASIGLLAPLLVLAGRLLQGFSAGAESGGVSVYLAEIAPPSRRGFYVAWQSAGTQLAVISSAGLGLYLQSTLTIEQMNSWGWRIPFLIGCSIVPVLILIRKNLKDTKEFQARKVRLSTADTARSLIAGWRLIVGGSLVVSLNTTLFYLLTAYTTVFGRQELHLSQSDTLIVTMCVGLSNFLWLPIMGALSDRLGRRPVLLAVTVLALITSLPLMGWLAAAPSFNRLFATQLWLSFIYAGYTGALIVWLTEVVPPEVRTTSFSLIWSASTAIFGGFSPAIATWLIHVTDSKAAPGICISISALIALIAVGLLSRGERHDRPSLATGDGYEAGPANAKLA